MLMTASHLASHLALVLTLTASSLQALQAPRGTSGGSSKGQAWRRARVGWPLLGKGKLPAALGADILTPQIGWLIDVRWGEGVAGQRERPVRRQGAVSARDVRCDLRRNKLTSLMLAPAAGWVPACPLCIGLW